MRLSFSDELRAHFDGRETWRNYGDELERNLTGRTLAEITSS